MADPQSFADRHRRVRSDHAAETAEDYAEAIEQIVRDRGKCRIVDLARRFDVSHVTVTKVVARLKREGLVTSERYGPLELTDAGRQLAAKSRRQHQIVYEFLRAIGVSAETAAIDAEGIEHHVSRQTLECFRRVTETLRADPDEPGRAAR
ncbi:MAG TPA: manganese-binding transcriptional regulator MntR [Lacipirellulaceae bacterium]|nr:manganese-binding transcriptional regulator MntR [Lacipirellulaceae bacterium]